MNKQELIEEIKNLENHNASKRTWVNRGVVLELVEELDEPQKVTVPQFVADWIEKNRGSLFGLNYDSVPSEIYDWVYEEEGNLKKIHLACAIGYTVEKEKRYLVKFIGVGKLYECLNFDVTKKAWMFFDCDNTDKYRTQHTRKELEDAGFGDVFNSPLFEVEEVE